MGVLTGSLSLPLLGPHSSLTKAFLGGAKTVPQRLHRRVRPHRQGFVVPTLTVAANFGDRPSGSPAQPTPEIPQGTVLGGRYEIDEVLGRGGNAVTYRCRDVDTDALVAVKALSLRSLRDWKQLELFQREAQILENLDHPGIPRYIDSFEEDSESDRAFFLVQELAAGESLDDMVARGWRADENEISRIASELLAILKYLGARRPAVVHRDVKPSNVVVEGGRSGGQVYLVDFGGVQAAAATGELPSSTVVGTYGFMAPEQFRGAAQPASDLYGLGATLLYLLSGRPPSAFPVDRMRLDLSSVAMGPKLEAVVEGLLEPVLEDRLSAEEALAILAGKRRAAGGGAASSRGAPAPNRGGRGMGGAVFNSSRQQPQQPQQMQFMEQRSTSKAVARRKPVGSRVTVTKKGPKLEIDIPPSKLDSSSVATGGFAIAWNAFVAFWTVSALAGGGIIFALFSIPFWIAGGSLIKQAFGRQFVREKLELGLGKWNLKTQLAGLSGGQADWSKGGGKEVNGRTSDLAGAALQVVGYINGQPQGQLVLKQGVETIALAEGLDPLEQEWLADVINAHLEENASIRGEIDAFVDDDDEDVDGREESYGGTGYGNNTNSRFSAGVLYNEFAEFDKKLGIDAAVRAGVAAGEQAQRAGQRAAEDAKREADKAAREAKRAASRGQRQFDPSSTIELDSGEFDVLDD